MGGGCLIISKNPLEFAEKYFFNFYQKIINGISENINKHFKSLLDYNERVDFLSKKLVSIKEKEFEISKLSQTSFFSIPIEFIINSSAHYKHWEKGTIDSICDFGNKKIYNNVN